MVLPRTRAQDKLTKHPEEIKEPGDTTAKAITKASPAETKNLQKALEENRMLKENLDNLRIKYYEKKQTNKELNKILKSKEQKITEQENYIMKLKKDRKKAEQVHKQNVSNLVTTSAQNQALMTVLSTQQQPLQQMLHPQLLQNLCVQSNTMLHPSVSRGMLPYPYPPLYPTGFNNFLPIQQPQYQVNPSESYNENCKPYNNY